MASLLPVGTLVQVTPFPTRAQDHPYRGIVRGYDLGHTKYRIGAEYMPERFADPGSSWAFPREVTPIETGEVSTVNASQNYAEAVLNAITGDFIIGPSTADLIREHVARNAAAPSPAFSLTVDSPNVANWVLAASRDDKRRVVLVCRRYRLTEADTAREERINAVLRDLPL